MGGRKQVLVVCAWQATGKKQSLIAGSTGASCHAQQRQDGVLWMFELITGIDPSEESLAGGIKGNNQMKRRQSKNSPSSSTGGGEKMCVVPAVQANIQEVCRRRQGFVV
jgi:hypothetical protein